MIGMNWRAHRPRAFVPAPPPQSAPPVKIVSPNSGNNRQSVNPMTTQQSSPYKKTLVGAPVTSPPPLHKGNNSVGGGVRSGANDLIKSPEKIIQSSYSTEELNQEMANLEGLMKDLNAITANDNSKRLMDVPKFANLSKESSKLQRLEHGMIPENSQSSAIYYIPTPRGS